MGEGTHDFPLSIEVDLGNRQILLDMRPPQDPVKQDEFKTRMEGLGWIKKGERIGHRWVLQNKDDFNKYTVDGIRCNPHYTRRDGFGINVREFDIIHCDNPGACHFKEVAGEYKIECHL